MIGASARGIAPPWLYTAPQREDPDPTELPAIDGIKHDPFADLQRRLRQDGPRAHDNLTLLLQAQTPRPRGDSRAERGLDTVEPARRFLRAQARLEDHLATLRDGLSEDELALFEARLEKCLNRLDRASQALLEGYRAVHGDEDALLHGHQPEQFAQHTLAQAGREAPGTSSFARYAAEDTKALKAAFDRAWNHHQLQHLDAPATRAAWNLLAGCVGQLSGTGLGAHVGRAFALAALAGGVAGVPAAAIGATAGLIITPVAHTLLADPLQAMLRDVTVSNPGAELQLELFKLKARLITDAYREQNGRPVRPDFKWVDDATGVVHPVTAREYLHRMGERLPSGFQAWTGKFLEEDVPYLFGDGLVGTLRPMLRGSDPGWWTETTGGRLAEWLGLQVFVLGPLCGAINHAVSQYARAWKVGRIPALERRLKLTPPEDRAAPEQALAEAREELAGLREALKDCPPEDTRQRATLAARIAALVGEGAREDVNKPMALWRQEGEWLRRYEQDLVQAIDRLETQAAREDSPARATLHAERAALMQALSATRHHLAEADAKSSVGGHYGHRLNTLLQRQHQLDPSEPETPGKRWETLSTILGKATGMLPSVALQVFSAAVQQRAGDRVAGTLIAAVLPPLAFVGGGGVFGWMARSELAGVWREAIAHARGWTMSAAPEARTANDEQDDVIVDLSAVLGQGAPG